MANYQINNKDKSMGSNSIVLVKFRVNDGTNYEVSIPAKPTDTVCIFVLFKNIIEVR